MLHLNNISYFSGYFKGVRHKLAIFLHADFAVIIALKKKILCFPNFDLM